MKSISSILDEVLDAVEKGWWPQAQVGELARIRLYRDEALSVLPIFFEQLKSLRLEAIRNEHFEAAALMRDIEIEVTRRFFNQVIENEHYGF